MKKTLQTLYKSRPLPRCLALLLGGLLLGLAPARLHAALPVGYLDVTGPNYQADPTGVIDATASIQAALNDAYANNQAFQNGTAPFAETVFVPPGTYLISGTLTCYQWATTPGVRSGGFHALVGSTEGGTRPVFVLGPASFGYQTAATPKAMLAFRGLTSATGQPSGTPNPLQQATDDWTNNCWAELRNIDLNCGTGNTYAVGVTFLGANCHVENVKVTATGALAGFYNLPARGSSCINLEVDGGAYGITMGRSIATGLSSANLVPGGTMIAGLKLENQTTAGLRFTDEGGPTTVAGFNIANCGGTAVQTILHDESMDGMLTLLDGQIQLTNPAAYAIDNSQPAASWSHSRSYYLRNVYITGTTNLVYNYLSSGYSSIYGNGTWSLFAESVLDDQNADVPVNNVYASGNTDPAGVSLINGQTQGRTALPYPVNVLVTNCAAPTEDFVSMHLPYNSPSYNGAATDPATVVVDPGAAYPNSADATSALQAALDQAHGTNGRVFLPAGVYYITNTLTLYSNTVLMGEGRQVSCIQASPAWQPATGQVTMLQTVDDPAATTTLAHLTLTPRISQSSAETAYARFNALTWRAGSKSVVLGVEVYEAPTAYPDAQTRSLITLSNHGGGHWYGLSITTTNGSTASGSRRVTINGTTQPLWFYGFCLDNGGGSLEAELIGASNVRLLCSSRRAPGALLAMTACTNVALYGYSGPTSKPAPGNGCLQVLGASANVLMASLGTTKLASASDQTTASLYEAVTGQPVNTVLWPNMVSVYKRGDIDDTGLYVSGIPVPALPFAAVKDASYPSMQIDLSWSSLAGATGYQINRSTDGGTTYSLLASAGGSAVAYNDNQVIPGTTYYYTLVATNASGPITNSPPVIVTARVNMAPSLNALPNINLAVSAPPQTVNLSGISPGLGEASQTLTVTAASSNPALIPNPVVTYSNPNATGTLSFTPAANVVGSAIITVTAHDNGGVVGGGSDTGTQTFTVNVYRPVQLGQATMSGGNVVLSGSGGATLGAYQVLSATNAALPLASWTPLATNFFGTDGRLSCTLPVSSSEPKRFYRALFSAAAPAVGYSIVQTPTAPVIDGTVDPIWSTANVAAATNVCSVVNNSYTNASQCSGTFQMLYDAANLYLLVQVADDATDHSTDSTSEIYENDAVEVYLDGNNTKQSVYTANDFHFAFSLVGTNAILMMTEASSKTNGVVAAWVQTGTNANYVLEVAFPWSLVGQAPVTPGALMGFDVQIDHAYKGGTRDFDLFWNCTNDLDYQFPTLFGTARLWPLP